MNDEERKLREVFDRASTKLKQPKSSAQDESQYSIAYQNLVKAGLAYPLKRKYWK